MKRILSVMLSIMLCVSCISVGTTTAFADNTNTYTPVVNLTPDMYTPKTVYVDDDFNNRVTNLSTIADGQTAYEHQVIITANNTTITNYGLSSDEIDTYAQATANYNSMALLDYNNKNVDKINVSFRFRFPTYTNGMKFYLEATQANATQTSKFLMFQVNSNQNQCLVNYGPNGTATTTGITTFTTQGANTWNRVSFQLERVADAENPGSYNVYIRKLVFIDSNGTVTNANTSSLKPVNVDWWSGSVKTPNATNKVALRIGNNTSVANLRIDDVMVYEPEDLKMSDAQYDSTSGKVKAVFTRGLKADTLSGITLKKGNANITSSVALDTSDTSNRTVVITPSETIDTANNLYTVTASGVQDGTEEEVVPTRSISFGTATGETETPEEPISVVNLTPKMYTPKTVYVDDDFNNRDTTGTDLGVIASGKTAYEHQVTATNPTSKYTLENNDTNLYAAATGQWKYFIVKDVNDIDANRVEMSFKFNLNASGYFGVYVKNRGGTKTKLLSIQLLSSNKCQVKYTKADGTTPTIYSSDFDTQGPGTWNNVDFELERTLVDGAYTIKMNRFCFTDSLGNSTNLDTSDLAIISLDWWSSGVNSEAFSIGNSIATKLCIDDVMVYEPEDLKMSDAYKSTSMKVKARFTRGLKSDTLGGIFLRKGNTLVDTTSVALDTSDTSGRTVIITPSEAIDTANNLYTVIAAGVQDVDGNAVPAGAITFGDGNGVIESLYVNGTEVSADNIGATAGQTISAYLSCVNTLGADAVITPIIGYYEGDTLMSVGFGEPATVSNGARGSYLATLTMPATVATGGEFRVFAIKADSMTPVLLDHIIKAN